MLKGADLRVLGGLRARLGGVDPVTPVVGIIALVVYYLHGIDGRLSLDTGIYAYGGQQVAEGVPPYEGVLNRAGPLAHMIPAVGVLGARMTGQSDLVGMRLLFMLISVACVCLVYLVARDLFRSRLAGVAAATAFLTFYGFIEYAANGPREKTSMVLFLLCALWAVVRQRWLLSGVSVSLATLVWQPVFFLGLAAALVAILMRRSERIRSLVLFVAGGLVPLGALVLYFAAYGALDSFAEGFVLISLEYAGGVPFWWHAAGNWSLLREWYGPSLWVLLAGLAALLVLTVNSLRPSMRRSDTGVSTVAVGAAALAGLAWVARDFNAWPDAILLLPLGGIGVGGLAAVVIHRLPLKAAVLVTAVWAVVGVTMAVDYSLSGVGGRGQLQRGSVEALLGELPPGSSILSIQAPQALVYSGKTNPTRHQYFVGALTKYIGAHWPGGLAGYGEWIAEREPTVIALLGKFSKEPPGWLRDTLGAEYEHTGRTAGWEWYVHDSVGQDDIRDAREAIKQDRQRWRRNHLPGPSAAPWRLSATTSVPPR